MTQSGLSNLSAGPSDELRPVLVTGAAGYIASHAVLSLAGAGYRVIGIDNMCRGSSAAIKALKEAWPDRFQFYLADVRDESAMASLLEKQRPSAVMHFAGLKSVEESCWSPGDYYDNNVGGSLNVVALASRFGVRRFVFSSSATVYDANQPCPVDENSALRCTNPYGWTKLQAERVVRDVARASGTLSYALLRYFNPAGADESGRVGESPEGEAANLMPAICRVAAGQSPHLKVFGNDYPTRDGTGVRDFVHVSDLADAHLAALGYLERGGESTTINLGSGTGFSVLEVVEAFVRSTGQKVPVHVVPRRPGDVAEMFADTSLAQRVLGWSPSRNLERMCIDAWKWQTRVC